MTRPPPPIAVIVRDALICANTAAAFADVVGELHPVEGTAWQAYAFHVTRGGRLATVVISEVPLPGAELGAGDPHGRA